MSERDGLGLHQKTGRFRGIQIRVDAVCSGLRLDQVLSEAEDTLSRTSASRLIKEGQVKVNGNVSLKPAFAVSEGDDICALLPEMVPYTAKPAEIPLDVLYEDADVLVVNKPKGMVVHPAAGHLDDTLVNAVLAHCGDSLSGIGGVLRPGIVHRIDKDTTGALIVCKNDRAHQALSAQLKAHSIGREYVALVTGLVKEDEGTIDAAIGRSATDRKKMAVVRDPAKGKKAVTHFHVLERFLSSQLTYLSCRLETGRTHQIRVHMAYKGHALLGDPMYNPAGNRKIKGFRITNGQCLHAQSIAFQHPRTGERMEVTAPLPAYFVTLLEELRNKEDITAEVWRT